MANTLDNVRLFVIDSLKKYHATLTKAIDDANTVTLADYVAKREGYDLSQNDFTDALKTKLEGVDTGAQVNVIESVKVNGTALSVTNKAVDVTVPTKLTDLTNDGNFVTDANYVHTDNNYTTAEKNKLAGIAEGAEVNVNADWNATSGDAQILNKPSLTGYFDYANYANKQIVFKNGGASGTTLFTIDCADFIKDGMIDNVSIEQYSAAEQAANGTSYLFIDFNTDSGKTDIKIPLKGIFDPNNYYDKDATDGLLDTKVDKVNGKQLSTEDYTTTEKTKLAGIAEGAQVNVIESVSVDGTALPVTAKGVNVDLSGKVDKVDGKGLSTNDYTTTEKTKLAGIAEGAQVNVIETINWNGSAVTPTSKAVSLAETQLRKETATGSGNVVTDISVSNHQITLTKGVTALTAADVTGKEDNSNKKTTIPSNISDSYYPSTSAVASYVGSLEELSTSELNQIFGISGS